MISDITHTAHNSFGQAVAVLVEETVAKSAATEATSATTVASTTTAAETDAEVVVIV
ncbi:hypothetical protein DPMN_044724 [Dreissena polymorpha]|uniref:Uncharacterized protein n=1 Tax=Dreissena polymorpha TaxID=45954 RepID=A0A9D4D4N9_DREPO|nr:hypothetical protein DPMN_044724 [Dreissena polymorpha]